MGPAKVVMDDMADAAAEEREHFVESLAVFKRGVRPAPGWRTKASGFTSVYRLRSDRNMVRSAFQAGRAA